MDGFATTEPTRSPAPLGSCARLESCIPLLRAVSKVLCWGLIATAWAAPFGGALGSGAAAWAQPPGLAMPPFPEYVPPATPPQFPLQLPMASAFAHGHEPLIFTPHAAHSGLQFLPPETLYSAYLAGPTESRLGTQYFSEADDGALWDSTLGGRAGLFRWGGFPGAIGWERAVWQLDAEGAAILRLDPEENIDLTSVDYRAGVPLTMAWGAHRFKFGYYHLSAHIGDEFLLKNPTFERLNYVRDALVFGYSRYLTERLRVYGEASWAFYREISDPWHLQFGVESAPTRPTGILGVPFFAINGLLREEVDFGGTVTMHAGWAWREARVGRMLRTGLFVQAGKSHQAEFYDESERQIGVGLWYDF
ncbi:DUF1207 domain-containing protein [Candidatus Laterigemmans baculatus]|uniref:DUF1207 domain-containing protein n=1 Tax=Candidatus Laterigemmans baculatus TaxID=2770505 RepID=UPI0013DA44FB|nr:DUF1207 domain-containing protein [Candidatus Laterigemmans baculatus]